MSTSDQRKTMALTALAENYGKTFSAPLLRLWLDLLDKHQVDAVETVVRRVIESYEYKTIPPFAVLKRELDHLAGVSPESLTLQAEAEWGILQDLIATVGYYALPDKMHSTTAYVVRLMGGWQSACLWTTSEEQWRHKDFVRHWVESHGRVEAMELGAGAVVQTLASGQDRHTGPVALEVELRKVLEAGERL